MRFKTSKCMATIKFHEFVIQVRFLTLKIFYKYIKEHQMDTLIFITLRTLSITKIYNEFIIMIYKFPMRKLFLNEKLKFSELKHLSN